jgi:adenylate cyclase
VSRESNASESEDARERTRRRLAAILVAGYSRLFSGDEADRYAGLTAVTTEIIEPVIPKFAGNVFKRAGDLVLVEFDSVVEAARCAAALRDAVTQMNRTLANERRIGMRIGINLGDIIVEAGDLFGDGVNIAARLEAVAEPGAIYVSGSVHDQVMDKVEFGFEDLGLRDLKNIRRPIHVYRMLGAATDEDAGASVSVLPDSDDRGAIAVLPFANFGTDSEQEFFADGITEDIISMLGRLRALPVIARNSTFTYKGQAVNVKAVGRELGARYVVEGSVRKSGRRVRVTVQLIHAESEFHIIAEKYDRDLTDLFELQDEIVTAIAAAIEPELLKFERDRIADRPQRNEDAYELYQRGVWHHYRHSKPDNLKAQGFLRSALAIDPQYPQATAALATALLNAAYLGWAADAEDKYDEAFELAQRAVALDPRYPDAHFALGGVCMWTQRSDRAISAYREAINLNPSFAAAHVLLGQICLYRGDPAETIALAEKGIHLSPRDPRLFMWLPALAGAHYQLQHYKEAIEIGRRAWALNRNWPAGCAMSWPDSPSSAGSTRRSPHWSS